MVCRVILASLLILAVVPRLEAEVVVNPTQDVMTSAFFFAPNFVRGYPGDGRANHRVGSDNAFNVGPETVYLQFNPADFGQFPLGIINATLTMESVAGGFGGDASPGNPFVVSAHTVNADPLFSITDDTNPTGTIDWFDFFQNNINPADPVSLTSIEDFGPVEFDVTPIVNEWLAGTNTNFFIAMTGSNSDGDFLHGFANNTETPGSTFLTVTAVPEPSGLALFGFLTGGFAAKRRRMRSSR